MLAFTSLLAFVAFVAAQGPTIATPAAVVQCQPAQISFVATNTPVFISIIPGGQPSAAPLQDLGQQNASPFTWVASIAAGTQITFQIRDSTGAVAYSAPVTIQTSSDSSCIGAATSSGAASASGSATQTGAVTSVSSASASSVAAVTSSEASFSSSVAAATSSIVASASSAASSIISSATAPATTSRATSAGASSSRSATATSATPSASASANAARSNMQVGFAGLIGLAAAVVIA